MADFYARYNGLFGGSGGGGGGTSYTPIQEEPAGAVDASNVTFELSQTPFNPAIVNLTLDGVGQRQGIEYTISGTTITMAVAPLALPIPQELWAQYEY